MNKLERRAAMIVAAAAAGVVVSGVKLMKKHTRYLAEKAAATFGPDDEAWEEPAAEETDPENPGEEETGSAEN